MAGGFSPAFVWCGCWFDRGIITPPSILQFRFPCPFYILFLCGKKKYQKEDTGGAPLHEAPHSRRHHLGGDSFTRRWRDTKRLQRILFDAVVAVSPSPWGIRVVSVILVGEVIDLPFRLVYGVCLTGGFSPAFVWSAVFVFSFVLFLYAKKKDQKEPPRGTPLRLTPVPTVDT